MLVNILEFLVLVLLALLAGWLTSRAWRLKRRFIKWPSVILAGLLSLVFLFVTVVAGRGLYILYAPHPVAPLNVSIANTSAQVARGEHIASSVCADCHSINGTLPLSGGKNMSDDIPLPLGDIYAPNLTPAGPVKNLSDADIWRIFRHGVLPNGRLAMMPVNHLQKLSDDDLQAVISYLRSQPEVAHITPPTNPSLLMAVFLGAGLYDVSVSPVTGPVNAPPQGNTAEYGAYIVNFVGCADCHGNKLDGHPGGPTPPGPNLRVVQGWTEEQFINTLRTGVDPTGHQIQPPMPWESLSKMDNEELGAIYHYLKTLPPLVAQK